MIVDAVVGMAEMALERLNEGELESMKNVNMMVSNFTRCSLVAIMVLNCYQEAYTNYGWFKETKFRLRLSSKLYAAIASWAEDDFRSVNRQIEYLLTEWCEAT